jgi:hypothetical protein
MSDFAPIPPKADKTNWNALLDHGLEKACSYIVRMNGATCEAVNGKTGLISFSSANVDTVMSNIIAAGGKIIFVKTGVTWTTSSIPAGIIIEGEDADNVKIIHPTPDAAYISIGSKTMLVNVSIKDKMGLDQGLSPNAYRLLKFYFNATATPQPCGSWQNQFIVIDTGGPGLDNPGIGVNQYGIGDAFWAGVLDNGTGLNIDVNNGYPAKTGKGIAIAHHGAGNGLWLASASGATGPLIQILSGANVAAIDIVDEYVPISCDLNINDNKKTGGCFINVYHAVSTYIGSGIFMNLGCNGGAFWGSFLEFMKDTVDKLTIIDNGDVKVWDAAAGVILKDRTTGTFYRLKVDNGVLGVEAA